jgi:flagellar basal-body rod modification protein FlgD
MSSIYALSSTTAAKTAASTDLSQVIPQKTLGQQDFLNLLVKQLQTQDPLNPMKDTEFISQMAQFSTLEQSKAMQTNLAVTQANSFLGHVVQVQTSTGKYDQGVVSSIQIKEGTPQLIINGNAYNLDQVTSVQPNSNRILN